MVAFSSALPARGCYNHRPLLLSLLSRRYGNTFPSDGRLARSQFGATVETDDSPENIAAQSQLEQTGRLAQVYGNAIISDGRLARGYGNAITSYGDSPEVILMQPQRRTARLRTLQFNHNWHKPDDSPEDTVIQS